MNSNNPDLVSGIVFFILFGVLGYFLVSATRNHRQTRPFQLKLFYYGFAVRFALSIIIYQFGLVSVLGDEDSSGWYFGVIYYQQWERLSLFDLPQVLMGAFEGNHRGYYYLLGTLFYFTNTPDRFVAAALNCFFGALTVVFAYRIAHDLFSSWVAERVGWWTCFFPSLIVWSAQTVKEPVVILLETVALYGCIRLKLHGLSVKYMILCASAIVLVMPFRFYAAYIIGAAVALALILPDFSKRKISFGSAIGVAALVIPVVVMSGILVRHQAMFENFDIEYVEKFRYNIAQASGSGVEDQYDLGTTGGLGLATIVGAAHLMLAPFPWQLGGGSLRMVMSLPELLAWWWLFFVGVVPGVWHTVRKRFSDIQPLLFFILGMGLLYSMMFGNVGLIFRQRAQLLPWLLIFAMVGLEQRALKKRARRQGSAVSHQPSAISHQPSGVSHQPSGVSRQPSD
ncbi:MAG: hypothetical protein L0229_03820 [Blastocatellia bacterium]|nr:hypothetical protein [Blastocatellia bacterium]